MYMYINVCVYVCMCICIHANVHASVALRFVAPLFDVTLLKSMYMYIYACVRLRVCTYISICRTVVWNALISCGSPNPMYMYVCTCICIREYLHASVTMRFGMPSLHALPILPMHFVCVCMCVYICIRIRSRYRHLWTIYV